MPTPESAEGGVSAKRVVTTSSEVWDAEVKKGLLAVSKKPKLPCIE